MFNKKVFLFFITLMFMLSVSAVAGVDTNVTDDVTSDDMDEEPPSGNITNTTVNQSVYYLNGTDVKVYYKNESSYEITLYYNDTPVQNASINFNINGTNFTANTDELGKASIPLNLNVGSYVVLANYGDIVSTQNNINVLSVIVSKDLTKTYKSSTQYSAKFLDSSGNPLVNTNIKFILNGVTYNKKTDNNGIAKLELNLKVGTYILRTVHPYGCNVSNKIIVKHSITTKNLVKHYKSSTKFTATFYGKNGKVLANKKIKFYCHGKYYVKKTNSKGIAKLNIISKIGTYKIISINPSTGEEVSNKIKVISTLSAKKMTTFTGKTSIFNVTLYKNDKLVKNAKVHVYIKGVKKIVKTDSNGVASVKFKLSKGTYIFKSKDPYTGCVIKTKVKVKLASIKAKNIGAFENKTSKFTATLLKQNGKVAKNTKMQITLNGNTEIVKTNSKGVATIKFSLKAGTYKVSCKDLSTGYVLTKKIIVIQNSSGKKYDKYGVSEDGKTILAIGRASASGEMSKYGYSFYQTEFLRVCPYCGSDELYWGIFWAGSETADYGVFPATGHKEGGSAEGHIFCAHCDSDWSIFGHNHGTVGGDLIVVSPPTVSSKTLAYLLKSGKYVHS